MRAPRTSRSLQQRGFVGKAGRGERLACEDDLRDLIRSEAWLMGVLHAARTCDPPHWAVGAGVLRSLVWGHLHHRQQRRPPADVDLAYFDSSDLRPEAERAWESCLKQRCMSGTNDGSATPCHPCSRSRMQWLRGQKQRPRSRSGSFRTIVCTSWPYAGWPISSNWSSAGTPPGYR